MKQKERKIIKAVYDILNDIPLPKTTHTSTKGFLSFGEDLKYMKPKILELLLTLFMPENEIDQEDIDETIKEMYEYIEKRKEENWN